MKPTGPFNNVIIGTNSYSASFFDKYDSNKLSDNGFKMISNNFLNELITH